MHHTPVWHFYVSNDILRGKERENDTCFGLSDDSLSY